MRRTDAELFHKGDASKALRFRVTATLGGSPCECWRCGETLADGAPLFVGTDAPDTEPSLAAHVFVGLCCFEEEHRIVYARRRAARTTGAQVTS